jgi:hypothetical protein
METADASTPLSKPLSSFALLDGDAALPLVVDDATAVHSVPNRAPASAALSPAAQRFADDLASLLLSPLPPRLPLSVGNNRDGGGDDDAGGSRYLHRLAAAKARATTSSGVVTPTRRPVVPPRARAAAASAPHPRPARPPVATPARSEVGEGTAPLSAHAARDAAVVAPSPRSTATARSRGVVHSRQHKSVDAVEAASPPQSRAAETWLRADGDGNVVRSTAPLATAVPDTHAASSAPTSPTLSPLPVRGVAAPAADSVVGGGHSHRPSSVPHYTPHSSTMTAPSACAAMRCSAPFCFPPLYRSPLLSPPPSASASDV